MAQVSEHSTSLCSHCDRYVPSSNIDLHCAHCSRNLLKCKVCGDMVPRNYIEKHLLSTHAPMESRDVAQTSNKRVFMGGSSYDPDVVVISESKFRKSKKLFTLTSIGLTGDKIGNLLRGTNCPSRVEVMNREVFDVEMDIDHGKIMHIEGKVDKHKKGMLINHEIIDVDMNEDYDNIMVIEGKANKHTKGKEAMAIRSLVTSGNMDGGFVDGGRSSKKRCAPGLDYIIDLDGGCDLPHVDEKYMDSKYLDSKSQYHAGYCKKSSVSGSTRSYSLPNRPTNSDFKASVSSYSSSHVHNVERATLLPNSFPSNRYPMATDHSTSQNNPMNLEKNVNNFEFQNLQVRSSNEEMSSVDILYEISNGLEKDVNVNEVLKKLNLFKKFDIVQDHSDHHYVHSKSSLGQPSRNWLKKIQEEWNILEKHLPDAIFVRVYESRMDLLRAVIVGAEGTPYHNGLFFFDAFFPSNYPHEPPHMYYHSWGLGVHPSLLCTGEVCLNLLSTFPTMFSCPWTLESTMLQVLVSIQGLVLTENPYSDTGIIPKSRGYLTKHEQYCNIGALFAILETMAYTIVRPPKHFEDFVVGHFYTHAQDMLVAQKAYMDGMRAGWRIVGAQDVKEGDNICSSLLKYGGIPSIVRSLAQIGVEDCKQFIRQVMASPDNPFARNNALMKTLKAGFKRISKRGY